jgi:hypothetical protein
MLTSTSPSIEDYIKISVKAILLASSEAKIQNSSKVNNFDGALKYGTDGSRQVAFMSIFL